MKNFVRLILLISLSTFLISCSYIKSKNQASPQKNSCINIKRQQMYLNTQYGQKEVSQIQTERMNLQRQYEDANCKEVLAKSSEKNQS